MPGFTSRPFEGEDDFALLIDFARRQTAGRWPQSSYWHPGDIVWQLYLGAGRGPLDRWRLWFDGDELAAHAVLEDGLIARFECRAGLDGVLAPEILDWAERQRRALGEFPLPRAYAALGQDTLSVCVLEGDGERVEAVRALGLEPSDHFAYRFQQSLERPMPGPVLPDGMRLRYVTDDDTEARAELHRDAWSVWGESRFSARRYRVLRAAPLYEEQLDVVVEGPDGRLLSSCIAWADDVSGIGHFEPVGTRPSVAGQGLGKATILEGLRRLRERGMRSAVMGTAGVNDGALRLYESCGFEIVDYERSYAKKL